MRKFLLLLTFAAVLATTGLAGAQQDSFFNNRFCANTYGGASIRECSFTTWEQCVAYSRGLGENCSVNRSWRGPVLELSTQAKKDQKRR
jgi:uncharacterized protein DUF3551